MIDEESQSNQSDEGDDTPFCSIPFGEIDLVHSAKPLLLISALSMRTNIDENCTGIKCPKCLHLWHEVTGPAGDPISKSDYEERKRLRL